MPMAIGTQNSSMSHQLPAAASQMRRPSLPQLPPLVYCSMSRASEPRVSPSQNMKENSQARRNMFQWSTAPTTAMTLKTTPTVRLMERMRSMNAGGAKSLGARRTKVWLIASHLPQDVALAPEAEAKYRGL